MPLTRSCASVVDAAGRGVRRKPRRDLEALLLHLLGVVCRRRKEKVRVIGVGVTCVQPKRLVRPDLRIFGQRQAPGCYVWALWLVAPQDVTCHPAVASLSLVLPRMHSA